MNRLDFMNQLAATQTTFNLGVGLPPLHLYPAFKASEYLDTFIEANPGKPVFQYHQTEGFLGELAATTLQINERLMVNSSDLLITNGVQEAIGLVALLYRNSPIACFDPYYPGLVEMVTMTGNHPIFLKEESWLEQVATLPEGTLIYLSADYANPTGRCLSLGERQGLMNLAVSRNLMVFDDATYREFHTDGKLPCLSSFAPQHVIHALSFSKIVAPGLRMAFICLPAAIKSEMLRIKANLNLNSSGLTQAMVGGWLLQHHFRLDENLSSIRVRLKANSETLRHAGISYAGGFFTSLQLPGPMATFEWCARLLQEEMVSVCPMMLFSDDRSFLHQIRISIANIECNELTMALDKIKTFINR